MSFNNKWLYGQYDDNYDFFMSQKKNIFGVSFRNGMTIRKDENTFEYYLGIGYKFAYNDATYHYYKSKQGINIYYGDPPAEKKPIYDNGIFLYPYISFGFKYGFNW